MVNLNDGSAVERRAKEIREDEVHRQLMHRYEQDKAREASRRSARQGNPLIYTEHGDHSYFLDMAREKMGHGNAALEKRLLDHANQVRLHSAYSEYRTGINTTDGTAGYAVPPDWLNSVWVEATHPGRPLADAAVNMPLPPHTNELVLPVLSTGTSMTVSSSQNSQVSEQAGNITDTSITLPVTTIQSQTTVSRQLLDFAPAGGGIDRWLAMDSGAAYAAALSQQLYSGSGSSGQLNGILNWPSVLTVSAGSSTAGFWNGLATAQQAIVSNLYLPPNAAFINQADWGWLSATVDVEGRPLLLPHTTTSDALVRVPAESIVAEFAGMSLIVDPSVPSGKVIVARTSELAIYESPLNFEIHMEYGVGNMSALIVAHRYVAFGIRRPAGVCVMSFTPTTPGS
jgi:HK97 family phage major capsid protein